MKTIKNEVILNGKRYIEMNKNKGYIPNVEDFIQWSQVFLDVEQHTDIAYVFLHNYINVMKKATMRGKLMFLHIYCLTYNPYYAIYLFEKYGNEMTWDDIANDDDVIKGGLKIGAYRRGVRMMGLPKAVLQTKEFMNGKDIEEYFLGDLTDDPEENYKILQKSVGSLPQNGLWATHKTIDLFLNVAGVNVKFTDWMAKGRNFGGKQFYLDLLLQRTDLKLGKDYKESEEFITGIEEWAKSITKTLNERCKSDIIPEITLDISETMACTFAAFYRGAYFLSEDIDSNYAYYKKANHFCPKTDEIYLKLREMTFRPEDRGELNGWESRPELMYLMRID